MRLTLILLCCLGLFAGPVLAAGASKVAVRGGDGRFTLLVDDKPFFIDGVGGDARLPLLKEIGGNAFRTWGADDLGPKLDEAQRLGLKVAVGVWLEHERKGGDYDDPKFAAAQVGRVERAVRAYKDHPAVLLWGIGNEMEGYGQGDKASIWKTVEAAAALAKRLDPNHPTMTVIAEVGGARVRSIHEFCPSIDLVGINSYAGLPSMPARYRAAGGTKPYAVTEFGVPGTWEVAKTDWGVAVEPTSTEKAAFLRKSYEKGVLAERDGLCLGSFAFLWGNKQETTATWFGLLLADGSRVGSVDVLHEFWTGAPPADRVPAIASLAVDTQRPAAGATLTATLDATDPEGEMLETMWELRREATKLGIGGDAEEGPDLTGGAVVRGDAKGATVRVPKEVGAYRLFVIVRDGHGGAATANVPLLVEGGAK